MTSPGFQRQALAHRALLSIEGQDAVGFLNGLVTIDVAALDGEAMGYGALLSPQGKILHDFFVARTVEGFLIDCGAAQRSELAQRLTTYKLRARVNVAARDELEVGVLPDDEALPLSFADPRLSSMGYRMIAPKGSLPLGGGYEEWRIAQGLGDSEADIASGKLFPHEANLDQIGGLSFTKGCYVGQEVVSRMEHRSTARSRIVQAAYDGPAAPLGSILMSGEKNLGVALSALGSRGLALVRLDRLAEAETPILTNGVWTQVTIPAWLKLDQGGESGA